MVDPLRAVLSILWKSLSRRLRSVNGVRERAGPGFDKAQCCVDAVCHHDHFGKFSS